MSDKFQLTKLEEGRDIGSNLDCLLLSLPFHRQMSHLGVLLLGFKVRACVCVCMCVWKSMCVDGQGRI